MSVEKVREYLKGYGVADRMQEFTVSSAFLVPQPAAVWRAQSGVMLCNPGRVWYNRTT